MENLKGSLIRSLEKSHSGEIFVVKIDKDTKEMLKLVFIKLLNKISDAVAAEQMFCQEFFNTKINKPEENLNTSVQVSSNNPPKVLNRAMSSASISSSSTNSSRQLIDTKNDQ